MSGHVLAARLDSAGDVLVTGPAIRAIAARADKLTLLAGPRGPAPAPRRPRGAEGVALAGGWGDLDTAPGSACRVVLSRKNSRQPVGYSTAIGRFKITQVPAAAPAVSPAAPAPAPEGGQGR